MKNCYGNKIKEMVELNPLDESFYHYFIKKNTNVDYEHELLKNLITRYYDVINFYVENYDDISFDVYSFEDKDQEDKMVICFSCPEKEIEITSDCTQEGLFEFLSKLTESVLEESFYTTFCEETVQEAFKKYVNDLWNYYRNYNITVHGYKRGSKDAQFTSYINLLLQDTDSGLLLIEQINFLISLFNNVCQSLLKGEYLIYDEFAKKYLTHATTYSSIEESRIRIAGSGKNGLQNQVSNDPLPNENDETLECEWEKTVQDNGQEQNEEDTEQEYFKEDLLSFFRSQCAVFTMEKDKNYPFNSKELLYGFFALYRETNITYLVHYKNVSNILTDYIIFIEKIKKYTEIKQRQHFFNIEEYEPTGYENNVTLCINKYPLATTVTALAKIMQYIFHLILDMCLVDHNYVSTDKNLMVLLRLHCILQPDLNDSSGNHSFFMVLDSLKKRPLINKKNIEELENTMDLMHVKNDLLLLKMRKRSGYSLKDIVYHDIIPEQVENIHEKPYYLFLPSSLFLPNIKSNVIYEHYRALMEKNSNNRNGLKDYEQIFTEIICNNGSDYETKYKQLAEALNRPLYAIVGSDHEKIFAYNNVIYFNFINHFIKYGRYIKKLKIEIKNIRDDNYLKEVSDFVESNKESGMISCAFILKHLEWLDKVLADGIRVRGEKSDVFSRGFDYIRLSEILLNALRALIKKLESDSYCMNYSSFFQDCFFRKEGDKVERIDIQDPDLLEFDSDKEYAKNVFFLSSVWQPPVSLNILKIKYEHYTERAKLNASDFYRFYIEETSDRQKKVIEDSGNRIGNTKRLVIEEMHKLLTENKKDTVQILGIFAAFLGIATVGLGNLSGTKGNPVNIRGLVTAVSICFGYFILLLQLVSAKKTRRSLEINIVLIIFISVLTIFLILLLII